MSSYRKTLPWIIWFLASFFYAFQYVLRILPGITIDEVMSRFQIDAAIFGQFSGIYYLGYAGMHIPIGMMLDRIGPRKVLPVSLLVILLGLTPLLFSNSWVLACVGRLLIGMGSSAAILGVFKVVRMAFSEERFGRMLGFSVTIGLLGAIYGGQPVTYLLHIFGLEKVLYLIIFSGLVLCVFLYMLLPDHKEDHALSHSIMTDIGNVIKAPHVLLICLFAGLMVSPMEGYADGWSVSFLSTTYGFDKATAASLSSLIFIGMCVGSPLLPLMAEKSRKYYELIIVCALVMAVSFFVLLLGKPSFYSLSFLFFVMGISCAYQILAIYKASTYVPESLTGLTTASANMIIMAFGYIFHSTIGSLMESTWDGTVVNGVHIYSVSSFKFSLMLIPVTLLVGALGFLVIRRRSLKFGGGRIVNTV